MQYAANWIQEHLRVVKLKDMRPWYKFSWSQNGKIHQNLESEFLLRDNAVPINKKLEI